MNRRVMPTRTVYARNGNRSLLSICGDVLAVLVGLSTSFVIHLVGDLPVAEICTLAMGVPLLVVYRQRAFRRDLMPVYMLMGLWLVSQIVTDVYRHTELVDWMRGDAAIIFFALDLSFAAMLLGHNERRKVLYVVGLVLGSLAVVRLQPTEFSIAEPWKFGYSQGVNLGAVILSCYFYNKRRYIAVLVLLAAISAVNLAFNYRSPVLIFLLTIALVVPVIPEQVGRWRVLPPEGTRVRLVVLTGIAMLASLGAVTAVKVLSTSGALGDEAKQKNQRQSSIKGGILIGGRPEILVSSIAVKDSPILGHGSWAKDFKYVEILYDTMIERGDTEQNDIDSIEEDSTGLIPAHSHLMNAWVWAGIMGAVFWAYVWWLAARGVAQLAMYQPRMAPLYVNMLVGMLWNILFSPFGSGLRMIESVIIVISCDLLSTHASMAAGAGSLFRRKWQRGVLQPRRPVASGPRALPGISAGD